MRVVRYDRQGKARLGVREGSEVVDLSHADRELPSDVADLLRGGPDAQEALVSAARSSRTRLPVADLKMLPPAVSCGKIICLGLNYVDHAAEGDAKPPEYPMIFFRAATSLVGHNSPMIRPDCSNQFDYEAELVAFIGKKGRHISRTDALSHVAGYSVFNDGSIRDYQWKTIPVDDWKEFRRYRRLWSGIRIGR